MTPSARLAAVLDLLQRCETARIPMDGVCGDYFRVRRYIGAKDRAAIAERVYEIARAHERVLWWLEKLGVEPTVRARLIAFLCLFEGMNENGLTGLFGQGKYSPDALTDEEREMIRALKGHTQDHPDMPEAVRVECPPAYEAPLRAVYGADFAAEMAAMITSAPLDLRVNTLLSDRNKAKAYLEADGVETTVTPMSPFGLRAKGKTFLSATKAFTKGWVDIQDEGSQMIALMCAAEPGMQVLDYCAGAGGKTLALAAMMSKKGRIVAMDTDGARLARSRPRFKKAFACDIIEIRPLEDERHRKWLRRQKGTFDVVLTDVPCSGSGTWRRNPDLRRRVFGPSLEELLPMQAEILDKVAGTVKVGGRLVYATCSQLTAENEDQVAAFLGRHPEFRVLPLAEAWPKTFGACPVSGEMMRLTPHRHGTDAFFAAVMVRTA